MKPFIVLLLAGTALASQPTPEAIQEALTLAQNQWGYTLADAEIQFRVEPLNSCPLAVDHTIATTQMMDYVTTLRFDNTRPVVSHRYVYVILLNSACDWSRLDLIATVEHEYGHVLIGPEYHSRDKRSIMYRAPVTGQVVTRKDERELARALRRRL